MDRDQFSAATSITRVHKTVTSRLDLEVGYPWTMIRKTADCRPDLQSSLRFQLHR